MAIPPRVCFSEGNLFFFERNHQDKIYTNRLWEASGFLNLAAIQLTV